MSASDFRAVDCHAHVIDPARFPLVPGAGYQPRADEVAPREDYWRTLGAHGVSDGLLVQPSCYAYDNRALQDALAASAGRLRGIAVVPVDADDASLDALQAQGVVGVRLNLGSFDPGFLDRPGAGGFLQRMRERELFVQVYASASSWARVAPVLMEAQVRVIVDHMGEPDVRAGIDQPGFSDVLALGRSGRACVKLSAPYRIARTPAPFEDVVPYARACLAAFGAERCLWGSDWPFLAAPRATTYGEQQAWLEAAVPEAATRRLILVDNPRRLFGMRGAGVEAVA